ncbi:MAG: tRNA pseudouridine(55) synthase TruB [Acutalibacteraceae bacterium]|nr:tRNA pseudouridine(55) synthase TruB [Acutalibacteraceae bacterium]
MQGLLLINKPEGITSFKAVSVIRRLTNTKKIGHTGTLDPLATGVLPILLGRATCLCDYLLTSDKRYTATVKAGVVTDTLDITGNVIKESLPDFSEAQLKAAIEHFTGDITQYPPVFSAIKKDGVPLYKLARQGKEVEVEPRQVTIHSIKLLSFNEKEHTFKIDVLCSKGTYIRSLCRDIGEFLGCGATMTELTRTKTGDFSIEQCVGLDDLTEENISSYLLSEELAVSHFSELFISEKQAVRFSNGGKLSFDRVKGDITDNACYRIKYNDTFIGIGYADGENKEIRVKCLVNQIGQ